MEHELKEATMVGTPTNAPVEATNVSVPTPAKKAAPKKDTPTDKALIIQLKKELQQEKAAVARLTEELETQQQKNVVIFKNYQEAQKALDVERQKNANAKSALLQTVDGAMRAFANS